MSFPHVSNPWNMRMVDPPTGNISDNHKANDESCYMNGPVIGGQVSCEDCINRSLAQFKTHLGNEKKKLASKIVSVIKETSVKGISVSDLLVCKFPECLYKYIH